jgi:hypothetical protein
MHRMRENPDIALDPSSPPARDDRKTIEEGRGALLHAVSSGRLDTLQERVAWILNHSPDTRDSDIALQIKYWEAFEPDLGAGEYIRKDDLYRLT